MLDESNEGAAMSYLGKKHATQKQLQWEEKRTAGKHQQTFKKKRLFNKAKRSKLITSKKNKKRK